MSKEPPSSKSISTFIGFTITVLNSEHRDLPKSKLLTGVLELFSHGSQEISYLAPLSCLNFNNFLKGGILGLQNSLVFFLQRQMPLNVSK